MTFSLSYLDPPWRFEVYNRESGLKKSADNHYPTMTRDELMAFAAVVDHAAAKDALLVGWAYDPMYDFCMDFYKACGFSWVTPLFHWNKIGKNGKRRMGTGYHTRGGGSEECWLFKRGRGLKVLRHDIRKDFDYPIMEHSRKPPIVRDWLVQLYGDVPRIEYFARGRTPGWSVHGLEVDKFTESAYAPTKTETNGGVVPVPHGTPATP